METVTTVGDNCHIASRAVPKGRVHVGDNVFIGSGAIIRENCNIASDCVIGMGALVEKDMEQGCVPLTEAHYKTSPAN